MKKNLWRRKYVRRAIFRKVKVRVEGGKAPFNPYFVCNTSNCVTVQPARGHLTPKMNIAFFIRNLMPNAPFNPYFVCNTSNCVTVRPVRGHLTPKMNITFFIRNLMLNMFLFNNVFEKSCIFRENHKKPFWGRIWQFFREEDVLHRKLT